MLKDDDGNNFIPEQFTDDYIVKVDAHSNSPIFTEDLKNLAFNLFKAGAIDQEALLDMLEPPMKQLLKDKLKTIFDPEIPVDIYELGLIYDVRLKDKNCEIDMTLTSPNCPEAQSIPNNVRKAVESLGHYDEVVVRIVWDPPWDKSKMSEVAKLALNV